MRDWICRLRDFAGLLGTSDFDGSRVGIGRAWELACILHPRRAQQPD